MASEKYLIINADDFGMCHATNQAIHTLITEGSITATSLMVNCPWAFEAVNMIKQYPQMDVGIHVTHTSEWEFYKWGPLNSNHTTLTDEFGYFKRTPSSFAQEVDSNELLDEAIAQIELALQMGVDPTNIDNHMGSMHHWVDLLLELCDRYQLPLRYSKQTDRFNAPNHKELVEKAEEKGISLPDRVIGLTFFPRDGIEATYEWKKKETIELIRGLEAGVTELLFHPSLATDELKHITDTWQIRQFEFDVFRDKEVKSIIKEEGIKLIGWRELRDAQRSKNNKKSF